MTLRRVLSGSAIAMFLGTISPNIICNIAAIAIAAIQEAVSDAPLGAPKFSKSDLISSPTEGSARIPRITLLRVIPSCDPESCFRKSFRASNALFAVLEPPSASSSSREIRLATKEISVATKTELTKIRKIAVTSITKSI